MAQPACKRPPFLTKRTPLTLALREHLSSDPRSPVQNRRFGGDAASAAPAQAYSGGLLFRLSQRSAGRIPPLAAAAIATLLTCGCSFSYNLGSLTGKDDKSPSAPTTPGDVTAGRATLTPTNTAGTAAGPFPNQRDLAQARNAVAEAFSKVGSTQSTPWENPASGAHGTITPIGSATRGEAGGICRDFLASYVRAGNEAWLEGLACRTAPGQWTVKRLTPWKQA